MKQSLMLALSLALAVPALAQSSLFEPIDIFELEWASDPRSAPDGSRIAYVRNSMDIMSDQRRAEIWIVNADGSEHRPLVTGAGNYRSPRWSPDGNRLLYLGVDDGPAQLHLRWMDSGQSAQISHLESGPSGIEWSPDGRSIAFSMNTPADSTPMATLPRKPEGAEWAEAPRVIERMLYRADGGGYIEDGFEQIFVLPAEGGTARQVTAGDFHHGAPLAWTPDGERLIFSANRRDDWQFEPNDSEIWELTLADGKLRALTDRRGPDHSPALSPDGSQLAYLGLDDRYQGYQPTVLYLMDADGSNPRPLTAALDRDAGQPQWTADGRSLLFTYDDRGDTKLARVDRDGTIETLVGGLGGLSLGRPYSAASFHLAAGRFVLTTTNSERPADLASGQLSVPGVLTPLTRLNEDLLADRQLAQIEELWFESSFDGRRVQAWLATPPNFDPQKKYPLVLEIHGGPFANYGLRFAAEIQLYAAAGYVVLYANPRGSTSYGEEFGNLIHHHYPGEDYDDLMSAVDAAIARGFVDADRLFVTGGSGGGVLTAWIVGKTDRFRAAVAAKPVINWTSFVFTSDAYNFFYRYWFPGLPWQYPEQYWQRSPLSLAGNVTTPTMLLTGEVDYRTPISESEQFYQALQLEQVESALVRIPGASHGIARRPSQLLAKVAHVLAWFERYDLTTDP